MKKFFFTFCTVAIMAVAANAQDAKTETKTCDKSKTECTKSADAKTCTKGEKTAESKACCTKGKTAEGKTCTKGEKTAEAKK